MRKLLLTLLIAGGTLASCTKEIIREVEKPEKPENQLNNDDTSQPKINTEIKISVESNSNFDNKLYPSLLYSLSKLEGLTKQNIQALKVTINSNQAKKVAIVLKENEFAKETRVDIDLVVGSNEILLNPQWKYNEFRSKDKAGFTYFELSVYDENNKKMSGNSLKMENRSINECVMLMADGVNDIIFTPFLFASYVNEDSKLLDHFLGQTLQNHKLTFLQKGWIGYQGTQQEVAFQVLAILIELKLRGFKYSSITNSSNSNTDKIVSQYVRFIDESLKTKQANCVDGSVLLSSILEKIGLDTFLVTVEGHMYVGYYSKPNKTLPEFIETTEIGRDYDAYGNYVNIFTPEGLEFWVNCVFPNKPETLTNIEDMHNNVFPYSWIDIKSMRQVGIKPIQ